MKQKKIITWITRKQQATLAKAIHNTYPTLNMLVCTPPAEETTKTSL
jgi:hypothetical protein